MLIWEHWLERQKKLFMVSNGFPNVTTSGQQYNIGEKPSVTLLYTYVNLYGMLFKIKMVVAVSHIQRIGCCCCCCCHPIYMLYALKYISRYVCKNAPAGVTTVRKATHPSNCGTCLRFLSREGFSPPFPSSTLKSNLVYPRQISRSPRTCWA